MQYLCTYNYSNQPVYIYLYKYHYFVHGSLFTNVIHFSAITTELSRSRVAEKMKQGP